MMQGSRRIPTAPHHHATNVRSAREELEAHFTGERSLGAHMPKREAIFLLTKGWEVARAGTLCASLLDFGVAVGRGST